MTPEEMARMRQFLGKELPKVAQPVAAALNGAARWVEALPAALLKTVEKVQARREREASK